jgi:hypothetical protein
MVKMAVPVFLMIKGWIELPPTTSFPKLKEVGLTWIAGAAGFTVNVAAALITVPTVLLTTTSNVEPLSAVVVASVV